MRNNYFMFDKNDGTAVWPSFRCTPDARLPSFYNVIFQEEINNEYEKNFRK